MYLYQMYTQLPQSLLWVYSKRIYANIYVQSRFQLAGNRIVPAMSDAFENKLISKWFTTSSQFIFTYFYQHSRNERIYEL